MRFTLVLAALVGCATQQDVQDLEARVKALEDKMGGGQLVERPAGAPPAKAPQAPNSPENEAATALLADAQKAIAQADYETARAKLAELQQAHPTAPAARSAQKLAAELSVIGKPAPPLQVEKWYTGKADLAGSDATLLLFWETWCPHCRREMPKMQPLADRWQGKGLQVVGLTKVTKSATDESVQQFIDEHSITFPMAKEQDGQMSNAYGVSGVPAAAIVKDGKIIWRGHPARLNDELIQLHLQKS